MRRVHVMQGQGQAVWIALQEKNPEARAKPLLNKQHKQHTSQFFPPGEQQLNGSNAVVALTHLDAHMTRCRNCPVSGNEMQLGYSAIICRDARDPWQTVSPHNGKPNTRAGCETSQQEVNPSAALWSLLFCQQKSYH